MSVGEAYDPGLHIVVTSVFLTKDNSFVSSSVNCNVRVGPPLPSAAAVSAEATRLAPLPATLAGGTDYVVKAAVVFYATGPGGAPIESPTLHFPLGGYDLTARLTLAKTQWTWGDGTTTTVTRGDLVGNQYTDSTPCESATVCSKYISHIFTTPARRVVRVEAFWDVKVTLDGVGTDVPVTGGGIFRTDNAGKTITLHTARAVLVGSH